MYTIYLITVCMSSVVHSLYNYRVHTIAPEILLLLHTFLYIQSTPTDLPKLVCPTAHKIDLIGIQADLPKFSRAGIYEDDRQWWEGFISNLEAAIEHFDDEVCDWPLQQLLVMKQKNAVSPAPDMNTISSTLQDVDNSHLPEQISRLREKQNASVPQVLLTVGYVVVTGHHASV